MTPEQKYRTKVYKNGFVLRSKNKRIECLQEEVGDNYILVFYNARGKLSDDEKKQFPFIVERMGITFTETSIGLFKESFEMLKEGFSCYAVAHADRC